MSEYKSPIPSRIYNASVGGHICGTEDIIDDTKNKTQKQINSEVEESLGTGGSVDSRIASAVATETSRAQAAEADRYTKSETYTKEEVHNLITTPSQKYVSVTATAQTTAVTDLLPATGAADTTYRVGNWDGSQYNDSVFSEYAWNGTAYIKLSTKSQIGEVYDISANHADTKYADLAAALGTDGANVPEGIRKGGMSVKFVQNSDNKYVQFRLIANEFTTDVTKWVNVEEKVDEVYDDLYTTFPVTNNYQYQNIGGYYGTDGEYHTSSGRGAVLIEVTQGATYQISTYLSSSLIAGAIYCGDNNVILGQNLTSVLGYEYKGTGTAQTITNQTLTIPNGTKYIIAQTADLGTVISENLSVSEITTDKNLNFYTKEESDDKYISKYSQGYGVKWSISDYDDLGTRVFAAEGLTASIGIGNTNGHSDFDTIYPWSEMKRCNININANGAKIVTFEGESGFSLDGSNGDVFVRIPKFKVEKYIKDGYEYRTIGSPNGIIHPAFIENGKELDEIFVSAFEGVLSGTTLKSYSGIIPANNIIPEDFLQYAHNNGTGYSLYDSRTLDAIWTLFAIEFGCRNTNHILGYGVADLFQAVDDGITVIEAANNTNTIKCRLFSTAEKNYIPIGSNVTICDITQTNIIAQRKLIARTDGADYTEITIDGSPISVTTSCFVGSAPMTTNFCESCGNDKRLNWHTGRADFISGSVTRNPIRYRWMENLYGNVWQFLPDVSFNALQMYVCDNMKDYEFFKVTSPYRPVSGLLTQQTDNGSKGDVVDRNYWITSFVNDIFAKGVPFGKTYNKSLLSTKAFGAYYYLGEDNLIIANGGGFDHLYRCNMLTQRAWITPNERWFLYGARIIYKNLS